jgi:hypothetical protein
VVRFRVDDQADGAYGAGPDQVRVRYRYGFRGVVRREWGPVARDSDPSTPRNNAYMIPIAYQTLLPQGIVDLPPEAGRPQNFLALSRVEDEHFIEVEAIDAAGNRAVARWLFRLDLTTPPLRVSGCGAESPMASAQLADPPSIIEFFQPGTRVLSAALEWPLSLPSATLVARPALNVTLGVPGVYSTAQVAWTESFRTGKRCASKHTQGSQLEICANLAGCKMTSQHVVFDDDRICHYGPPPWTRYPFGGLENRSDPAFQGLTLALRSNSGAMVNRTGNSFILPADEQVLAESDFQSGIPWAWDRQTPVVNGGPIALGAQYRLRHGWVSPGGTFEDEIFERSFLSQLESVRGPLVVTVVSQSPGGPLPEVKADPSCRSNLHARWTVHGGPQTWVE